MRFQNQTFLGAHSSNSKVLKIIFSTFFKKSIDKLRFCDIIYRYEKNVPLAQPDRVFGYEPKGRGFESLMVRQKRHIWVFPICAFFVELHGTNPWSKSIAFAEPMHTSNRLI